MSESLEKLKKPTEGLPVIPNLETIIGDKISSNVIEYNLLNGKGFGWGLFKCPEIAVQRAFLPNKSTMPEHKHPKNIREWIICYIGEIDMIMKGETHKLLPGQALAIEADIPHSAYMHKDTWILAITIPANMKGYPNAP